VHLSPFFLELCYIYIYIIDPVALCGTSLDSTLVTVKSLKIKAATCKSQLSKIKARIAKELDGNDDATTITTEITAATGPEMLLQTVTTGIEKNHYFLRIFDILYCKL